MAVHERHSTRAHDQKLQCCQTQSKNCNYDACETREEIMRVRRCSFSAGLLLADINPVFRGTNETTSSRKRYSPTTSASHISSSKPRHSRSSNVVKQIQTSASNALESFIFIVVQPPEHCRAI